MTGKYAVPIGGGKFETTLEGNFWPNINGSSCGAAAAVGDTAVCNWYDVSYRALIPKDGTGANLLVPVALSASAVAYSSTRIENMFMSLGAAAGVAAKQLVDGEVASVQAVDVAKVQGILTGTFKQRIHGPPNAH
jgi:hypothetical protein